MQKSNDFDFFDFLSRFTYRQVGVSPSEFQVLPGNEVGAKPQGADEFLYRAYKLFFPREQSYSIVAVAGG
jgi:hypothetical protein